MCVCTRMCVCVGILGCKCCPRNPLTLPLKSESVSRSVMSDSFEIPWTVAGQTLLFIRFSKQEYWSGLPLPSPGDLPNPEIKLRSPELQADSLPTEPPGKWSFPWQQPKQPFNQGSNRLYFFLCKLGASHSTGLFQRRRRTMHTSQPQAQGATGPSLLHFQPQNPTLSAGPYQLPSPQGSLPAIQPCSVRLPFKVMISETLDSTFLNILIFIHVILWPKKTGKGCREVSTCDRGS